MLRQHIFQPTMSKTRRYPKIRPETLWDPKVGKASGNGKRCKGMKMINY